MQGTDWGEAEEPAVWTRFSVDSAISMVVQYDAEGGGGCDDDRTSIIVPRNARRKREELEKQVLLGKMKMIDWESDHLVLL